MDKYFPNFAIFEGRNNHLYCCQCFWKVDRTKKVICPHLLVILTGADEGLKSNTFSFFLHLFKLVYFQVNNNTGCILTTIYLEIWKNNKSCLWTERVLYPLSEHTQRLSDSGKQTFFPLRLCHQLH